MTSDQRAAILDELEQFVPLPDLGPGEITANDIGAKFDMTRVRAIGWARRMVKAGRLKEAARYDRRICKTVNAWWPVDGGSCTEKDDSRHDSSTGDYLNREQDPSDIPY